jgi:hypothetical protein
MVNLAPSLADLAHKCCINVARAAALQSANLLACKDPSWYKLRRVPYKVGYSRVIPCRSYEIFKEAFLQAQLELVNEVPEHVKRPSYLRVSCRKFDGPYDPTVCLRWELYEIDEDTV